MVKVPEGLSLEEGCFTCNMAARKLHEPEGFLYGFQHWVAEPITDSLPLGTIILKPWRHVLHVWDLTDEEAQEIGSLLRGLTSLQARLLQPDQVYVCLWSQRGWQAVHIHFVLQPSWNDMKELFDGRPGPALQAARSMKQRVLTHRKRRISPTK